MRAHVSRLALGSDSPALLVEDAGDTLLPVRSFDDTTAIWAHWRASWRPKRLEAPERA